MNTLSVWIKRHSFVSFVVLAYALSWWIAIPMPGMLAPWGPALAALIVVGISEGKSGVKVWWRKVVQRNTRLGWVLLAALIPLVIPLTAARLNLRLGAQVTQTIDWTTPLFVLPIMLLVSGMWEEPGWTGFALPRLQERFATAPYGTLIATLIMAVIRTGWHLPLMLSGSVYWSDMVGIVAAQIVISWLFNASDGSVLAVMLLHLLNNIMAGEFVMQWFSGADSLRLWWLLAILWSVLALGLLLFAGLPLGRKPVASGPAGRMAEPASRLR